MEYMSKMNKKGIVPALIIPIAIGILILIVGLGSFIGILSSTKIRFLAIGITIMVMTFIYVIPSALQGDFSQRKMKFIGVLFLIGGVFIALPYIGFLPQTAFAPGTVYVPQYGNMECSYVDGNYNLYETIGETSTKTITCGKDMKGYTNFCKFQLDMTGGGNFLFGKRVDVKVCNNAGTCKDISGVKPISGYFDIYSVNLDVNQDGYITTQDQDAYATVKFTSQYNTIYNVRVLGNAYFLKDTQGNGYGTDYEEGCNLLNLNPAAHVTKQDFTSFNYQQAANQVPFGKRISYVWGLVPAQTSNIITKYNKQIYVEQSGYYSNIITNKDGYKYVDWQNPVKDSSIQCAPSNIYTCNADATIRTTPSQDVSGQTCSLTRGVALNTFYRTGADQVCYFRCANGVQEKYNCQAIATCGSGYIYDGENNRCVQVSQTGTGTTDTPKNAQTSTECSNLAAKYPYLDYTWVTSTTQPTVWQEIITFGGAQPTTTGYCKSNAMPYYILGIFALVVILMLTLLLLPSKKSRRK
jgi:hypothetical protein